MHRGYIKLWRKTFDNPFMRKPTVLALWVHLLLSANHKNRDEMLGGKRITCGPGQFTTGRKQLSEETGIPASTIERLLNCFENEHQIKQQKTTVNRLITILNWSQYQQDGQPNGQQVDSEWTASGQRVDTPKECKNVRMKELKDPATPGPSKDASKQIDLTDVNIKDQSEGVKHKVFNLLVETFRRRGWKDDAEYVKHVFKNVVNEMEGYNPKDFYPYFQKVAFNHINRNAEMYSADARIKRGQEVKLGLNVGGISI